MDKEISDKINEVVKILKQLTNDEPMIALAGAHAKGIADKDSDLDIFMFTDDIKPFEERKKIIENICDDKNKCFISEDLSLPWGGSIDFPYKGTPVETVVRLNKNMNEIVNNSIEGKFEIIPQTWTSNGYYTFTYLSELDFIKPIYDPNGILTEYKKITEKYPLKLKKAIIREFLGRASTWIGNFHYESAIKREDILFTSPIVLHTVLDMVQVIFALNEKYFTGDKKLERVLKTLDYCPAEFLNNLEFLLDTKKDSKIMQKQYDMLKNIYNELTIKSKEYL